ncbi:response regulator transcription factor [Clavibacter michiganensis]|uniref:response regulator transcription factor n=1 Tax=Clavibacter michiganensis TaxID=28447 RepID=UPI001D09FD2F|nr:response regulator transcription factor [Clavibacter michiganensis]MDO4045343.1 response regulator transcription factor [Clavibacter michiganensis]MDO4054367.1 response regulator transcription factor [Clavibacter michiganensis]MDO4057719.1 response regulator transcription factor [Clavibacter michiganensis]MDO4069735.1 response regulator transcription factor [Clavibacter michiganensis]UDM14027.1 response regulator transcription factor [Clavibacter michiganensis subsp. michiganensis]
MGSTLSSAARDDEQAVPGDAPRVLRVFVVDEEAPITQLLSLALRMEGWDVRVFATGRAAIDAAVEDAPDAILLDMTLPDVSGVEVVGELRRAGVASPVLFLTGRDSLEDRLAAFGAGADDYVTKPFGLEEVVETLRVLFRRRGLAPAMITAGDLVLDPATGEAWLAGVPLELDPMDLVVVQALAEEPTRRLSRRELVHRLTDAGWDLVAPRALLDLPSVTGRRAGRDQVALIAVAGDDLVLAPAV